MNTTVYCNGKTASSRSASLALVCSLAASGLVGSLTTQASAQTRVDASVRAHNIESAEQYAAEAFVAYGRKDYRRALLLYKKALQAAPGANILYNLARIYDLGLHERVHAMLFYRRYLDHPSAAQPRSEYAELRITELRAAAPVAHHLKSTQDPPRPLSTPSAASQLHQGAPGSRTLDTRTLAALPLATEGDSPEDMLASDPSATPWTTKEISAAVLGGAGLVSLLVAARLGASAYWEQDNWKSDCNGNLCSSQEALDSVRRASVQANRATVALAAGASLVTLASALLWAPIGEQEQDANVTWDLQLPRGQAGLSGFISGKF